MILQECLDKLARGKIGNLAICENGKIKEKYLPKVIDAINEALLRIYTQLPIKENSVLLELYEGRTEYELTSEHSVRNAKGTIFDPYDYYIRDTEHHPFMDDILVITEVQDDLDRKRSINDPEDPLSVYVPESNLISVNFTNSVRVLNIIYRAKHKLLTLEDLNSKVDLPDNLFGALLSYTAFTIHSDMNTETAVSNAQKYFAEYQNIINEIIQSATLNPDKLVLDYKFIKRGWV